jgi:hypothetical protein
MASQDEVEEEAGRRPLRQLDVRLVRIDRKLRLDGRGSLRLLPEDGGQVAVVAKYPLYCFGKSDKKILKIVITLK